MDDDDIEDKFLYHLFLSHYKLLLLKMPQIWRIFRNNWLKPEVILLTLCAVLIFMYLKNGEFFCANIFQKIKVIGTPKLLNNVKTFNSDDTVWEKKVGNIAVYALQGRRDHMEDRFVIMENINDSGVSFLAVFDGHGGAFAADYATEHLMRSLKAKIIDIKNVAANGDSVDGVHKITPKPSEEKTTQRRPSLVKSMSQADSSDSSQATEAIFFSKLNKFLSLKSQFGLSTQNDEPEPTVGSSESYIEKLTGKIDYGRLLTDEVLAADSKLIKEAKIGFNIAGSTALIAVIESNRLIVANVGDSRGVMCDAKGNAIPLSFDHKPEQMREKKRIQERGGFVSFNGVWRVSGVLATSRALGDYPLKERRWVIAEPDILTFDMSDHKPKFVILASDGLWDTFTNEEAVSFIKGHLGDDDFGARSLVERAYAKGSADNITVMVVDLSQHDWKSEDNLIKSQST